MKKILYIYKSITSVSHMLYHNLKYNHMPYHIFLSDLLVYYTNNFSALANLNLM